VNTLGTSGDTWGAVIPVFIDLYLYNAHDRSRGSNANNSLRHNLSFIDSLIHSLIVH